MTTVEATQSVSTAVETNEQHSIGKSLALHLLPGVFILALFLASAPFVMRAGFPSLFAMVTVGVTFGLGFQVWHLYYEGKKLNGKWSLDGIVKYREPMPVWQYFVLVPLFVIAAFIIDGLTSPIKIVFLNMFPSIPQWFELRDISVLTAYPKSALTITFVLHILLNGIAAPIIEEMYFRGYLMARISRFGRWTPVLESALFTLYHFWQPYYWISQFFFILPVVSAVYWKRNFKLGLIVHMALNTIGGLLLMAQVLGQ
ncbi:MAG: CPBP family intramembrane glutamic endopeptidase [Anaerolineales bacterium]